MIWLRPCRKAEISTRRRAQLHYLKVNEHGSTLNRLRALPVDGQGEVGWGDSSVFKTIAKNAAEKKAKN